MSHSLPKRPKLPPPPRLSVVPNPSSISSENLFFTDAFSSPAGFWIRFVATVLDAAILSLGAGIAQQIFNLVSANFGYEQSSLVYAMGCLLLQLMVTHFLYWRPMVLSGQSYGKKLLKLKIVSSQSTHELSTSLIMKRELLGKLLSFLPLGLGYLLAAGANKKALHDRIFGTRVIRLER